MIADKTVFILGAGASKPYGFPTAFELRKDIIKNFISMFKYSIAQHRRTDSRNITLPEYDELIDAFNKSSTKSIDFFLSRNKKYYEMGKYIISFMIAHYEMHSQFREDMQNSSGDWYSEIYDRLTNTISDPSTLLPAFKNKNISFITFNYDRSLEHFFYESFSNSFITEQSSVKAILNTIKFHHLYGKIAPLPWQDVNNNWKYGELNFYDYIENYVNNIKIIYDDRLDNFEEAKKDIKESRTIFFLGFGYADENLKALDFNNLLNGTQKIYGTALGSTPNERENIISKLKMSNLVVDRDSIVIDDCDSVLLLRKYLK